MATLDELATRIATAGSLTVGEDCFKGTMPAEPDFCAAVAEYGGLSPDFEFDATGITGDHPRVQVIVRGAPDDYATPRAKAETIYRNLATVAGDTLSSTKYFDITPLQPPFKMMQDKNGRYVIAFNCQIWKALS